MRLFIKHDRPIALYNCDKRECIGLFSRLVFASKYLYKDSTKTNVSTSLKSKGRMLNTIFDFPVTARFCNAEQATLLGDEKFLILNGYYEPEYYQMKGCDFLPAGGFVKGGARERGLQFLRSIGER